MPFTLSHPAAVLPLRRLALPFAALVAGSIAPDLGYFFSLTKFFREDAHTLVRSFTFCVPAGLGLLLAFTLLRAGLLRLLPGGIRDAFDALCEKNPWRVRRFPFTALAVLLGAWTHLFWDAWTHHDGYFVRRLPGLSAHLPGGMPASRLLQYASTVFGLAVLYLFFAREARALGHPIEWRLSWRWAFWGGAFALAAAFTAATFTQPWSYWLSSNEHRLPYLAIFSFLRSLAVITALASVAAGARGVPAD